MAVIADEESNSYQPARLDFSRADHAHGSVNALSPQVFVTRRLAAHSKYLLRVDGSIDTNRIFFVIHQKLAFRKIDVTRMSTWLHIVSEDKNDLAGRRDGYRIVILHACCTEPWHCAASKYQGGPQSWRTISISNRRLLNCRMTCAPGRQSKLLHCCNLLTSTILL